MPANRCPVHGIPDCSPLLNGCNLPARLAEVESLRADLAAAVARNAELQRENGGLRIANAHLLSQVAEGNRLRDDMEAKFLNTKGDLGISVAMLDDARAERDALRAELDNLRNRVTAPLSDDEIDDLGKELDNPNKVYQLDRIAACIESIITTRAALVRGSDDE